MSDLPFMDMVSFVRSARAQRLRITIRPDRKVIVTIPSAHNMDKARQFLRSKAGWVQKHLQSIKEPPRPQPSRGQSIDTLDDNAWQELAAAQKKLFDRLNFLSKRVGLSYRRVAFRCQRSKWGSCSCRNNISLNVNIAFLPGYLQDYILLHELAHTKVKNHSPAFWAELDGCTGGQARRLAKELKNHRMRLCL